HVAVAARTLGRTGQGVAREFAGVLGRDFVAVEFAGDGECDGVVLERSVTDCHVGNLSVRCLHAEQRAGELAGLELELDSLLEALAALAARLRPFPGAGGIAGENGGSNEERGGSREKGAE